MVVNQSSPANVADALLQVGQVDAFALTTLTGAGPTISHLSLAHLYLKTQGDLRFALQVTLPGNAVVDRYVVKITARRADIAYAATVAQLRGETGDSPGDKVIIVDFGTLRTVARVAFDVDCFIRTVEAWNGTEFPRNTQMPFATYDVPQSPPTGKASVKLASDIRTQKLRVTVAADIGVDPLMAAMTLMLPDAPRDLSLRVDGGAPVWSLPGPAVKGPASGLSLTDWNEDNQRLVDLTDVLAPRLGDPLAGGDRSFELLLESAEAGVLSVEVHESLIRRVRRADIAGQTGTDRDFAAEGIEDLTLNLPGAPLAARPEGLTLTAAGDFGAARRLPPVGPDPALTPDGMATLADLTVTPERAAIFRPDTAGLSALSGLRLNLVAGPDGAELSLVPWGAAAVTGLPDAAMADLTGDPVTLDPGASGWISVSFARPVEAEPGPWAALLVNRGAVGTALCAAGAPLRIGPAGGPWRDLPDAFLTGPMAGLGLACRAMGDAEDGDPPPVSLRLGTGPSVPLDPGRKPRRLRLEAPADGPTGAPQLIVTRLGPGHLTLSDIDVITDI